MSDTSERGVGDGQEGNEEKKISNQTVNVSPEGDSSDPKTSGRVEKSGDDNRGIVDPEKVQRPDNAKKTLKIDSAWSANPEIVDQLIDMGIDKAKALRALYFTGNNSAEAAISWIFENSESDTSPIDFGEREPEGGAIANEEDCDDYKMVFVVNCSLNMGVGKACAQVAHAALGLQLFLLENSKTYAKQFSKWTQEGETKVVLKAENADHLCVLAAKATSLKLPNYLVKDAGRTQIPAGSTTVLSIFGKIDVVDQVTRQLKLL